LGAEGFKRKITAIMNADIVGYGKLTGNDKAVIVQVLAVYKNVRSAPSERVFSAKTPNLSIRRLNGDYKILFV
jgi:hypothetical protein